MCMYWKWKMNIFPVLKVSRWHLYSYSPQFGFCLLTEVRWLGQFHTWLKAFVKVSVKVLSFVKLCKKITFLISMVELPFMLHILLQKIGTSSNKNGNKSIQGNIHKHCYTECCLCLKLFVKKYFEVIITKHKLTTVLLCAQFSFSYELEVTQSESPFGQTYMLLALEQIFLDFVFK